MAVRTHADKRHTLLVKVAKLSKTVRVAQKSYFATRSTQALNESRAAERDLDKVMAELDTLERIMGGDITDQASLFE
ncbi:hypothetical protein UFOVP178_51 [uncultured Caudovirales phage]|uniref:Uncharacterized protein n=1 Tax=uncultured Caudovirales phage TaxID=2100421 RepID=A0A6J7WCA2_9CAUD|nr:hypothetical protein UFOVP178_51 [uncultured Caudovirales phage]